MDLKAWITSEAQNLGFAKVGFAAPKILEREELLGRLAKGYYGNMAWMAKDPERKTDPSLVLEGCQTVIVLATNYYTGDADVSGDVAAISNYAWGDDYHDVIEKRLKKLGLALQDKSGQRVRWYVDTGPLNEKAWAEQAGLGWRGKHTNLITLDYGSYVFLSLILFQGKLEPDEPINDHCGTCTACLDACPTNAFPKAYELDARKCISYLTIEHRGEFTADQPIDDMGPWIYGCDVCQTVCPYSKNVVVTNEQAFKPRPDNIDKSKDYWKVVSKEEFTERFRKSPIKRTKWEGWVRNAKANES